MEQAFWLDKWKEDQIHFHQHEINPLLIKHLLPLKKKLQGSSLNCLVPLCGKSLDMIWLKENLGPVIGAELSQLALDQFWNENKLISKQTTLNNLVLNQAEDITLICHDFFDITSEQFKAINGNIDFIYDRAALIALPLNLREQYYQHIISLSDKDLVWILITLEYDTSLVKGPPFSILQTELEEYLSSDFTIELLESAETKPMGQKFKKAGMTSIKQNVYKLTKK